MMTDPLVNRVLQKGARRTYGMWERLGVHVTPVHFYQPIPDTRLLDASHWDEQTAMVGIDINEASQLALLEEVAATYKDEYSQFPRSSTGVAGTFYLDNDMFISVDAEMLYSFVRRSRPAKIVEAGSGFSSLLITEALKRNDDDGADPCDYRIFDPYAGAYVKAGLAPDTTIDPTPIESVPLEQFAELGPNDILFIDSSHVLRTGGDVQFLFLEVLPRLAPGVIVHVHDIFLPDEYPKQWVLAERRYWSEQYLLQAFLAFNAAWEVLWAGNHMKIRHAESLVSAIPSCQPTTTPGSFWMRRREDSTQ